MIHLLTETEIPIYTFAAPGMMHTREVTATEIPIYTSAVPVIA